MFCSVDKSWYSVDNFFMVIDIAIIVDNFVDNFSKKLVLSKSQKIELLIRSVYFWRNILDYYTR